jgi:putative ABC transport system ATP-binding protein
VVVAGNDLLKLSDMALNDYRRRMVGFVWQQKARNLIPYLQVEQNIELPMIMAGVGQRDRRAWVQELIAAVGLTTRRGHKLAQLSGGEQQRVAIAVALSNRPALLLADEPTGELDSATASTIFDLFHTLNRTFGLTVVIVSHDPNVARHVDRVVAIRDGKTSSETMRKIRDQVDGQAESGAEGPDDPATHVFEELMMLDSAGRLQVPKDVRERYGIGDRVHMEETPDGLLLRPVVGAEAPLRRLAPADEPPARKVGRLGRIVNRVRGRG